MSYLVDTDWVAAYLKGRADQQALLARLSQDGLAISLLTYGEIYEGIYYGIDARKHENGFREFLRGARVLPLNKTVMQRFARLRGELRSKGQLISDMDLLIAATAITFNLTLVTGNLKHFQRVAGLSLYES